MTRDARPKSLPVGKLPVEHLRSLLALGLQVVREQIFVLPETDAIGTALALDPLKLIASGALLVAVAPDGTDAVLKAIRATGVPVSVIGEVRPSGEGLTVVTRGSAEPLIPPDQDEIARAFESL